MKEDIRQILTLHKEGALSLKEAEDRLLALTRPRKAQYFSVDDSFLLSKVEPPTGEAFRFEGNTIRTSVLSGLEIRHGEMCDNVIDASKWSITLLTDGSISGLRVLGSAVRELTVRGSELSGTQISAATVRGLALTAGSRWAGNALTASTLIAMSLEESEIRESRMDSCALRDVRLEGTRWRDVSLRGVQLKHVVFLRSVLEGVGFAGSEARPRRDFRQVRFENCRLKRVRFTDCRLRKTTLRNLTLEDLEVKGVDLLGQTLDGDREFVSFLRLRG